MVLRARFTLPADRPAGDETGLVGFTAWAVNERRCALVPSRIRR